jgi:NAD(P)-dependent dehydrogenase (short-subunit alcohol dehydrogenase family)
MGKRIVLVTGASSGIGKECALMLAASGFSVFGGVRRPEDGETLARAAHGSLSPVILDITSEESVARAVSVLAAAAGQDDTISLVNNAGITVAGPLELLQTPDLRRQFEVNVFGQLTVTRSMLPFIRTHGGRIVLMGSIFGRISLPFVAPYTAAKFAIGAIADSLSIELRRWKIPVILIEPGNVATPIWSRTKAGVIETLDKIPEAKVTLYQDALSSFEKLTDAYAASGIPPARVGRAVVRALSSRVPRRRYTVGWDSRVYGKVAPLLPARLRQWVLWRMTLRR